LFRHDRQRQLITAPSINLQCNGSIMQRFVCRRLRTPLHDRKLASAAPPGNGRPKDGPTNARATVWVSCRSSIALAGAHIAVGYREVRVYRFDFLTNQGRNLKRAPTLAINQRPGRHLPPLGPAWTEP